MSLQYIIDGYNVVNHPSFCRRNDIQQSRKKLIGLIREKSLCGSPRNKATVVFDGYAGGQSPNERDPGINVIFSGEVSADEKIKALVNGSADPKNIIVVSNDNEIRSFARSCGSRVASTEDFIKDKKSSKAASSRDLLKAELNYTQIARINRELEQRWLKP